MGCSEDGQAIAEAAIVLPGMVFLLLAAVQLTQLQQARILADSAAFAAARTGIVMNGEQTLVFLIAIGWYVSRLLEDDRVSEAERSPAAN